MLGIALRARPEARGLPTSTKDTKQQKQKTVLSNSREVEDGLDKGRHVLELPRPLLCAFDALKDAWSLHEAHDDAHDKHVSAHAPADGEEGDDCKHAAHQKSCPS